MKLKRYLFEIIIIVTAILVVAPVIYYGIPLYTSTPDILYVKAKLFQVMQGNIYADPVTGVDTFHPPFYHLVLAPFALLGLNVNTLLIIILILNISLYFFFTFKIVTHIWNRKTAFLTCLLLVSMFDFMGPRYILLPTSFYFSISFYLAGLWLYVTADKHPKRLLWSAVLWGGAFLISPVYVFLLAATFAYELLFKKRGKKSVAMLGVFAVTIIPFIIQAISIYSRDLAGASAFALWRGVPDITWVKDFIVQFLSPIEHTIVAVPTAIHFLFLLLFAWISIKTRRVHWFVVVASIAYLLTFYHFDPQYATRIHLFLSIFITAAVLHYLTRLRIPEAAVYVLVGAIALYSYYFHYKYTLTTYDQEQTSYVGYARIGRPLWQVINRYLNKNQYIFCSKKIYLQYIMPYCPVHSLGAHKTMAYYQVSQRIADVLEEDYNNVLNSTDYDFIMSIADKYGIQRAVASGDDMKLPLFKTLVEHWPILYRDKYFVIMRRP